MKLRKRFRLIKLLLGAIGALAIGCSLFVYLNKERVVEWMIQRPCPKADVKIGNVRVQWNKITLQNISISEIGGEPLFEADLIRADFKLSNLVSGHIDDLLVQSPTITIRQDANHEWNFETILSLANGNNARSADREIKISNARVEGAEFFLGANSFIHPFGPIRFSGEIKDFNSGAPLSSRILARVDESDVTVTSMGPEKWMFGGKVNATIDCGYHQNPSQISVDDFRFVWDGKQVVSVDRISAQAGYADLGDFLQEVSRVPVFDRVEVAGGIWNVPKNQWVQPGCVAEVEAKIKDFDLNEWKNSAVEGFVKVRSCDFANIDGSIVAERVEGIISLGDGDQFVDPSATLNVDTLQFGSLDITNLSEIIRVTLHQGNVQVLFNGPQVNGLVSFDEHPSSLSIKDGVLTLDGDPFANWELVAVDFDFQSMLESQEIDRVSIKGLNLVLYAASDDRWNIESLKSHDPAFEEETTSEKANSNRGWRISEFDCTQSKLEIEHDFVADGKVSVGVDFELRDLDTANFMKTKGTTKINLLSSALNLKRHPVRLQDLKGNFKIEMGAGTNTFVSGDGWVKLKKVFYKDTEVDDIFGEVTITEKSIASTNVTARFYESPITGFAALYAQAKPVWYNAGLEVPRIDMGKLTHAMMPELFQVTGTSYLYLETVGTLVEPVTWASLKFKADGKGALHIKELPKLLAASSLSPGKQQLFLLAFDQGEVLPYKHAWLNADISAGTLTVSTYFERTTKWFNDLEVRPPPFQIPVKLLRQKGWLP